MAKIGISQLSSTGDVVGPASSTDNAVARYDGTTGKLIQNSITTIADDGTTVFNQTNGGAKLTVGTRQLFGSTYYPIITPLAEDASEVGLMKGGLFLLSTSTLGNEAYIYFIADFDDNIQSYIYMQPDGTLNYVSYSNLHKFQNPISVGDLHNSASQLRIALDDRRLFGGSGGGGEGWTVVGVDPDAIQLAVRGAPGQGGQYIFGVENSANYQLLGVDVNGNLNFNGSFNAGQDGVIQGTLDVTGEIEGIIKSVGITIDGGGSAITTGVKGYIEVPYKCQIQRCTMLADQSGSAVVEIWKDTYANYPPTVADKITAAAPPTISAAIKSQDSTLTGWTTTVNAGDILAFNVNSASTITRLQLNLKVRTIL